MAEYRIRVLSERPEITSLFLPQHLPSKLVPMEALRANGRPSATPFVAVLDGGGRPLAVGLECSTSVDEHKNGN